jgi:hypothetical protein
MNPSQYLEWLDNEIAEATKFRKNEHKEAEFNYWLGASDALECVKRKFLTIEHPSQLNESKEFTDGLE